MAGYIHAKEQKPYQFEGGAYNAFGTLIATNLKLTTWAVSEKAARRNFEAQVKRLNNLAVTAKITLEGTIK